VICALPFATAVARPVGLTVATAALVVVQVTPAVVTVLPFWSLTAAVSCQVAPMAASETEVEGVSPIVVATGGPVSLQVLSPGASASAAMRAPSPRDAVTV
jgi:hypothetical protein